MKFRAILALQLIIFCHAFTVLNGAKILVFSPMPFKSHARVYSVLVEELAGRGHHVTALTSFPLKRTIPNYREIVIKDTFFAGKEQNMTVAELAETSTFQFAVFRMNWLAEWTEDILNSEPVQRLVSSRDEYDVIMGEFLMNQQAFLAFGHRFNAHIIALYPQHLPSSVAEQVGNPLALSYHPDHEVPFTDRMSFMERLHNTFFGIFNIVGISWYELPKHEALANKYLRYPGFEHRPPLKNMIQNISLVLVNSHFSSHYSRALAPNVIEIGGYHIKPLESDAPLAPDVQNFMDSASEGFIFVSFGTVVKSHMLSKEREETLVSVFKAIKQRVLWRWDNPAVVSDDSKVMTRNWIPQQRVLAHPNCVLFLTHGGIASLMEGIYYSIPLIGIPFMVDQFHNVEYIQTTGIGLKLDNIYVTQDRLHKAVTTILSSTSYKNRIKEQSRIMRDQPESPLERAVFWVEYVIRHNGAHHLKPSSVHLPFYQYILLDLVVFILLVLVSIVYLLRKRFFTTSRLRNRTPNKRKTHDRKPKRSDNRKKLK